MPKIWKIARHEYLTNLRRPGFIFFTLLMPALGVIALIVAVFFSGQASRFFESQFAPKETRTGIVDESHVVTPIPSGYADRFTAYPNKEAAQAALGSKAIAAFAVIPADYVASGKITVYAQGSFSNVATANSSALRGLLVEGLLKGKVDTALLTRVAEPVDMTLVTVDASGKPTTTSPTAFVSGFLAPYFISVFLVISIFVSSSYLLRSVSEEKETRVIEIILSSVSSTQLLAGKVIGLGALGLTQVIVWLVSAFALSGGMGALAAGSVIALNPTAFLLAAVYFLLGYLVYGIIMATAGSLGTTMRESQQLAGIFSFTAAIPYIFGGFLFANPNATIARILSFFPLTAPTMMMLCLPLAQVPREDIVISLLVLLVTIPVVLWVGARIFRMGLLMYGKRPSLGEIFRVFQSA